jgi:Ca2+/H+ antiporter
MATGHSPPGTLARDKIIAAVLLTIVGVIGVAVLVATIPQHRPASPRGHAPTIYPDT